MLESQTTQYRLHYEEPNYFVKDLSLTFELDEQKTVVISTFTLTKNPNSRANDFVLNGSPSLTLCSIMLDNIALSQDTLFKGHDLHLINLSDTATITIKNSIHPAQNKALQGIFITDDFFCSDCEPQGFRHITYFPDRPDIMTTYTVKLIAAKKHSALLSNGNLIESGDVDATHHYAIWHDPFPKPTYLFALVAGDLDYIEDHHIRPDHSQVRLRIYAKKNVISQCHFALSSLKRAMKWDETRFNLICDLDFYNIVAVNDFNGGAMENKGLNIFNTKYILADEKTATDDDFKTVEAVIGHEYFHNWTGNRITCRDWFNLSLKEGLTVFREQEFTADLHHRGIKRIEDVMILRAHQFPEDCGPLAHPVRPDQCEKVENFYTTTVYEKGAEVIRLYQIILGKERFDRGIAHYISTYDGQAVTTDEFLQSMETANNLTLPNFDRWYSQAGTPHVYANTEYRPESNSYRLSLRQELPDTAQQRHKLPQVIPIKYALFSTDGTCLVEDIVILNDTAQCLLFHNIEKPPILSLLRDFSAPVILHYDYSDQDLMTILHNETDSFSRWEAMQQFSQRIILSELTLAEQQQKFIALFAPLFEKIANEPEFYALLFTLPTTNILLSQMRVADAKKLYQQKAAISKKLAHHFEDKWNTIYQKYRDNDSRHRAIRNCALHYLSYLESGNELVKKHYQEAQNMTDKNAALSASIEQNLPIAHTLLDEFLAEFRSYPTVVDMWFSAQTRSPHLTLDDLDRLVNHPLFSYKNPNRARSVLAVLGQNNIALHQDIERFYNWLALQIYHVDQVNPQTATRLINPFTRTQNLAKTDQQTIKNILNNLQQTYTLSNNLQEQITKIL